MKQKKSRMDDTQTYGNKKNDKCNRQYSVRYRRGMNRIFRMVGNQNIPFSEVDNVFEFIKGGLSAVKYMIKKRNDSKIAETKTEKLDNSKNL